MIASLASTLTGLHAPCAQLVLIHRWLMQPRVLFAATANIILKAAPAAVCCVQRGSISATTEMLPTFTTLLTTARHAARAHTTTPQVLVIAQVALGERRSHRITRFCATTARRAGIRHPRARSSALPATGVHTASRLPRGAQGATAALTAAPQHRTAPHANRAGIAGRRL